MYKRIKEIAEKKRIQQKEIAEALNVGVNTVNNWFQENTSMKAEQIPLIAKVLRVSIEQIFQKVGTPLQKNLIAEEVMNVANEPCANCAAMQAEINKWKDKYIYLLENGTVKKENPSASSKRAG